MPLDVAEDVLCSGQRFRRGGAGIQPHGLQAGKDLSGCKGFTLPQYRLPQPGKQALLGPLLQKEACRAFQQGQRHRLQSAGLGRCFAGQLQCSARSTGGAQVGKRAFFAQGRTVRHADQRSQLHKGLIVVAGRIRRLVLHHAGGERFFHCRFRDGSGVVVQTGEHPQHIAIHGGHRDAEADGCNGSRRVIPDAGQGPQGIIVGGQLSAVLLADDACSLLQVAHPAVVAKTLPEFVQLFLFAGGKGRNVRQGGEKAFVVGQCRRDPGLLQHDLAEPHMVGAGVGAEGQDAVVFVKPVQQGRRDIFHLFCAPC